MSEIKIFITGEAWQSLQLDIEGFDFFNLYLLCFIESLHDSSKDGGISIEFTPTTRACREAATTVEELTTYDVVVLSGISYLLHRNAEMHSA